MIKYHDVKNVYFENNYLCIEVDGKKYRINIELQSKILLNANKKDRDNFEISKSGYGIHWPYLDEDLSIDGLISVKKNKKVYKIKCTPGN